MRRLILEVSEKELTKIGIKMPQFQKIKSLELLCFLRQDQEEFAAIAQVEFKDQATKVEELLTNGFLFEAQVLEQQKNCVYTVFIRGGPSLSSILNSIDVKNGYLFPPVGIRDGKIKISFLGSESQVREFLEKVDASGIRYKVVMLTDAEFSPISPLNQLTEKQREILTTAYKLGYYDIPRKINSEQLAKKLNIGDSTLVEHLRKAERRLLASILT
ncbi:MAG: helix-turn-helix domain-containing protein [Candidatus Bathyarchaeota archaeon]|nr:helix-turn-helix domain-containing protein [Candidatus Bathyarchaeota archaeon]